MYSKSNIYIPTIIFETQQDIIYESRGLDVQMKRSREKEKNREEEKRRQKRRPCRFFLLSLLFHPCVKHFVCRPSDTDTLDMMTFPDICLENISCSKFLSFPVSQGGLHYLFRVISVEKKGGERKREKKRKYCQVAVHFLQIRI